MTPDTIAPVPILAAACLVASGLAKLRTPGPTAQVLSDVGAPAPLAVSRLVGVTELAVGAWAVLDGGRSAWLAVAVCYLAFAGFLWLVLRRVPAAGSCGCAGTKEVPPSRLHLALDLFAAASCVVAAWVGVPGAVTWTLDLGLAAIPVLLGLTLAGWLAVVVVSEAPVAWRAWTRPPDHDDHVHDPRDQHARAEEALASAGIGPGHPSLWPGMDPETTTGPRPTGSAT